MSLITRYDLLNSINKSGDLSKLVSKGLVAAYDFVPLSDGTIPDIAQGLYPGTPSGDVIQTPNGIKLGSIIKPDGLGAYYYEPTNGEISFGAITGIQTICMSVKLPYYLGPLPLYETGIGTGQQSDGQGTIYLAEFYSVYINGVDFYGSWYSTCGIGGQPWLQIVITTDGIQTPIDFTAFTLGLNTGLTPEHASFEIRDLRFYSSVFTLEQAQEYHDSFIVTAFEDNFKGTELGVNIVPDGMVLTDGSCDVIKIGQSTFVSSTDISTFISWESNITFGSYSIKLFKNDTSNTISWMPCARLFGTLDNLQQIGLLVTWDNSDILTLSQVQFGSAMMLNQTTTPISSGQWITLRCDVACDGRIYVYINDEFLFIANLSGFATPNYVLFEPGYSNIKLGAADCFTDILYKDGVLRAYLPLTDYIADITGMPTSSTSIELNISINNYLYNPPSWDKLTIERSTDNITWTVAGRVSGPDMTIIFQDSGLDPSTEYFYRGVLKKGNETSMAYTSLNGISTFAPSMLFTITTTTPNQSVTIPTQGGGGAFYDAYLNFGDGSPTVHISGTSDPERIHVYATPGDYQISIEGIWAIFSTAFGLGNIIKSIDRWGGEMDQILCSAANITTIPLDINNSWSSLSKFPSFASCTSLTEIPVGLLDNLTTQSEPSGNGIFWNCSSITEIPIGLFDNCLATTSLYGTFQGTSITEIPSGLLDELPDLFSTQYMFSDTDIEYIPEDLFLNNIALTNLSYTFQDCSSLLEIPVALFAGTAAVDVDGIFFGCTSLVEIPALLFVLAPNVTSISFAFSLCTGISEVPIGLLSPLISLQRADSLFLDSNVSIVPATLFDDNINLTSISYAFSGTPIVNVPNLFSLNVNLTNVSGLFQYCTSLETVANSLFTSELIDTAFNIFEGCTALTVATSGMFTAPLTYTNVTQAFKGCTALTTIEGNIFSVTPNNFVFDETFYGCTALEGDAPDIWSGNAYTGVDCFTGDTGLNNYNLIPIAFGGGFVEKPFLSEDATGDISSQWSWTISIPVDSFTLEYSEDELVWIEAYSGTDTTFLIEGLTPETIYYVRVKATVGIYDSAWDEKDTETLAELIAPTLDSATPFSGVQMDLSWTNNDAYDGIEIWRSEDGINYGLWTSVSFPDTTFNDTNCENNTTYYYYLVGYTFALRRSEDSNIESDTTPWTMADSLVVDTAGTYQVRLGWDTLDNPTAEGYIIEISEDDLVFTEKARTPMYFGPFTYDVPEILTPANALLPSTLYYFRLRTYKGIAFSDPTASVSTTTAAVATGVVDLVATAIGYDQIDLAWDESGVVSPSTEIQIYRSETTPVELIPENFIYSAFPPTGEAFSDNGLSPETTYYYIIRGVDGLIYCALSNEDSATTPAI